MTVQQAAPALPRTSQAAPAEALGSGAFKQGSADSVYVSVSLCSVSPCLRVSMSLSMSLSPYSHFWQNLPERPWVQRQVRGATHRPPCWQGGWQAAASHRAPGPGKHRDCEQSATARPTRVSPLTRAHVWPDARAAVAAVRRAHGARAVRPRPPAATPTAPPSCTQTREIK